MTKNYLRLLSGPFNLLGLFFILALASPVEAATTVNGTLTGNTTWTKAGSPYLASSVTIPVGASLTVEPGTIIKVPFRSSPFTVFGTLSVGALDAEPVIITALTDDSVGGDTNNDGTNSVPNTGYWYSIFARGGTVSFLNTIVRYGGGDLNSQILNQGANLTIKQSDFSYAVSNIVLRGGTSSIMDSHFHDISGIGMWLRTGSLAFGNNVFARIGTDVQLTGSDFQNLGNNTGTGGIVVNGEITQDILLAKDTLAYMPLNLQVPAGKTLTIAPGAIIKVPNRTWPIQSSGTLSIGARGGESVVFTASTDDSVGGDTNNDGALTTPVRGSFCPVSIASGVATIINATFRYGGCDVYSHILNQNGALTLESVKFSESHNDHIVQENGTLAITKSEIAGGRFGVWIKNGTASIHESSIVNNSQGVQNSSPSQTVVDATNNWWGSDKGPFHPTNPGGLGNNAVSNFVLFNPWLTTDPFFQFPLCTQNCFSSILFLPGLQASRLYAGEKVWEPGSDEDAEKLFLDSEGKSIRSDVVTEDVLAEKPNGGNIYKSFLSDLEKWKNEEGLIHDYAVVPYDWRLSLDDILNNGTKNGNQISYKDPTQSPYIIEELRRLASTSKSGKVTIVAHSNGGLVTKALTNKLGAEAVNLIDKIVFVGVPQSGTPQAIGALLHGYDQGLPYDWFSFLLSPKSARMLANNMPGAYHLLPSNTYFTGEGSGVDTPVITFKDGELTEPFTRVYGHKIDKQDELQDFLSNGIGKVDPDSSDTVSPSMLNPELISYGESTHQTLDDTWTIPESIPVYQIAGFGEETVGTIEYWTGKECFPAGKLCLSSVPKLQYTPQMVIDGDGTVVTPSALSTSTSSPNVSRYWVDLKRYDTFFNLEREHADILEVSQLRDFIKNNILTQSTTALPNFISDSKPSVAPEKSLRYFLHSPLALSAHDSNGNEISASVSTIPGARYKRFGEVQYISLPADTNPTIVLDGQAEGSFTLEVQEVDGETITETTTFAAIPTSENTEVTMSFPDGTIENAAPLMVDYEGDSLPDFILEPKPGETVTLDVEAPTTTASFSGLPGNNGWYLSDVTVTLTAADNAEGSGVEKIKYSLDDGETWKTYVGPLTLSQEGMSTILYASVDNQGNTEEDQTLSVKIDKTTPEAKIQFDPLTQKLDIVGIDKQSIVTVLSSENITTLTDEAGHSLRLTFVNVKDKQRRIVKTLEFLSYDGVTTPLSATIKYKWVYNEKKNTYQMLASYIKVDTKVFESHYRPKKDITVIMQKPQDLDESETDDEVDARPMKEKLPGMVVPGIVTEKGKVKMIY